MPVHKYMCFQTDVKWPVSSHYRIPKDCYIRAHLWNTYYINRTWCFHGLLLKFPVLKYFIRENYFLLGVIIMLQFWQPYVIIDWIHVLWCEMYSLLIPVYIVIFGRLFVRHSRFFWIKEILFETIKKILLQCFCGSRIGFENLLVN